ncbi:MAG: DUF1080 domain-containing protein [Muribaculaceae bacterium]|nr:DUF1080 domain-containing protein [Muribaculaceae bacterium]
MKKIIIALVCALISASGVFAQDARQRTTQTIVVDALAQLPAASKADYNTVMNELVNTGAQGVEQLAAMLVPASKGKNNIVEYALDGMFSYASGYANDAQIAQLSSGLKNAIDKCNDNPNKAFLMTLLSKISRKSDAPFFIKYLNDEYLSEWAQSGLILTPNCDEEVLALAGSVSPTIFAHVAGAKKINAAEPALIAMLPAEGAVAGSIYKALANVGSVAALPVLAKAAKAEGYAWVPATDATASYTKLLNLIASDSANKKAVVSNAKDLLKKTSKSNVRDAAAEALFKAEGKAALPELIKGMKDADRKYRVALLRYSEPWADNDVYTALAKILTDKKDLPAKVDITNWFGTNKVASQVDVVLANIDSPNDELAAASIYAASKIGGDKALAALIDALNGNRAEVAKTALLSFNGSINDAVVRAIADNSAPNRQVKALELAGIRRIKAAAPGVFSLVDNNNAEIASAANAALVGVASVNDYGKLCKMLESAPAEKQPQLQAALKSAVADLNAEDQYNTVKPYLAKSKKQALYYPLLAQAGNSAAIAELKAGYANPTTKEAALTSLLQVNNPEMIEVLYNIAATEADANAGALNRYAALVNEAQLTNVRKYQLYRSGLEISKSAEASSRLLSGLASTGLYQALMIADKNTANAGVANAAAEAIRAIVNKNIDNYGGAPVVKALEDAANVFRADKGNADAGYAVDDINGMLAKVPATGYAKFAGDDLKYSVVYGAPGAKISAKNKKAADQVAAVAWQKTCCGIEFFGGEKSTIALDKELENFEMWFDWKGETAPVIGVRSMPLNIEGAFTKALNPSNEWNTVYVKVTNDRITVAVNGVTTAHNVVLENTYNNNIPAYATGKILLSGEGAPVEFRDIYVNELPSTPRSQLTPEEIAEGYEMLFDGSSLYKWTGNTSGYIPNDGYMYVNSQWGGNLYTIKEYSDFIYRFEFCFDRPGVNNGVGIRTPMGVDAAFHGMEIQILDHDDPIYKDLNDYQVHGSVYGVIPAKRAKFELGKWNTEEIRAIGDHITVIVNGEVILDGNIREACQGHAVGDEGEEGNHWMIDHRNHPGLFNKSGHIGFLGHGEGIRFRNVRVKDLSSKK